MAKTKIDCRDGPTTRIGTGAQRGVLRVSGAAGRPSGRLAAAALPVAAMFSFAGPAQASSNMGNTPSTTTVNAFEYPKGFIHRIERLRLRPDQRRTRHRPLPTSATISARRDTCPPPGSWAIASGYSPAGCRPSPTSADADCQNRVARGLRSGGGAFRGRGDPQGSAGARGHPQGSPGPRANLPAGVRGRVFQGPRVGVAALPAGERRLPRPENALADPHARQVVRAALRDGAREVHAAARGLNVRLGADATELITAGSPVR